MRWRAIGVAIIASAVAGCGSQPIPSSTQGSTTATASPITPSPEPTLAPSPTAGPAVVVVAPSTGTPARPGEIGLDWARQHVDEGVAGSALAHGPGGWVHLLSSDGEIPLTPDVAFSPDLRTWETVTPPGDIVQCGDGGSVASTSTTWLLRCGGLFRSADGRSWVQVPGASDAAIREVRHLVSDGRAFVGWRGDYPAETGIWSSTDGERWTRVELPGTPFVRVDSVIGRPIGGFVLAGRTAASAEDLREAHDMQWYSLPGAQAIWTSGDGVTWTAAPVGATFDGGRITGLAADGSGGGLVAVGYMGTDSETHGHQPPAVWRTSDLVTWQRLVGVAFDVVEDQVGEVRIVATADRWLLVGARLRENADGGVGQTAAGVTAGSEDGTAWWTVWPIELDRSAYISDPMVATADRLVILYNEPGGSDGGGSTSIWTSPPLD